MCLRYDCDTVNDDDDKAQESSCDIAKEWVLAVLGTCTFICVVFLCLWVIHQ
jgi:uncharacterized protein YqhQ